MTAPRNGERIASPADVPHDPAPLDVLALGHAGGHEHAGGGADHQPLRREEVLAVVVLHGARLGGGVEHVVERGRVGAGQPGRCRERSAWPCR